MRLPIRAYLHLCRHVLTPSRPGVRFCLQLWVDSATGTVARTQLGQNLSKPVGYGAPNTLLPAWDNNAQYTMAQIQGYLTRSG